MRNVPLQVTDDLIRGEALPTGLPGLTLAVFNQHGVTDARAYGYQDISNQISMTPSTAIATASLTKLVTAIAVHKEVERGRLHLDRPCNTFLPELEEHVPGDVTIRHLLTHTSGLTSTGYFEAQLQTIQGHGPARFPTTDLQAFLTRHVKNAEWVTAPGRHYLYSNEGYLLLGELVQRSSNQSFASYVERNIFRSLGIADFDFTSTAASRSGSATAVPYLCLDDGTRLPSRYADDYIGSAGGLVTTASGYAGILVALMQAAEGRGSLLATESAKEILTGHVKMQAPAPTISHSLQGNGAYYGHGTRCLPDFPHGGLVQHSGNLLTATAHFVLHPRRQIGVVALANGNQYPMENVCLIALCENLGCRHDHLRHNIIKSTERKLQGRYVSQDETLQIWLSPFQTGFELEFLDRLVPRRHYLAPVAITEQAAIYSDPFHSPNLTATFNLGRCTTLQFDRYCFRKDASGIEDHERSNYQVS